MGCLKLTYQPQMQVLRTHEGMPLREAKVMQMWQSLDPLAEEFMGYSPYNAMMNNPISFIDPDGRFTVNINGDEAEKATEQLNASTSLEITRDSETGKLSATGKAKTKKDKALLKAINDENITVNLNATSSNTTANGKDLILGAFGGNTVNEDGTITAEAELNPNQAQIAADFLEIEAGGFAIHEILESFSAAKKSPGLQALTFDDITNNTEKGKAFTKAHKKALRLDKNHVEPVIIGDNTDGTYKIQRMKAVSGVQGLLPFEKTLFKVKR